MLDDDSDDANNGITNICVFQPENLQGVPTDEESGKEDDESPSHLPTSMLATMAEVVYSDSDWSDTDDLPLVTLVTKKNHKKKKQKSRGGHNVI